MLLPLAPEPFTAPTDRDMLPSERRQFVVTHRTCVFGHRRRNDGPGMSVVYYIPTDTGELLVSTMAGRGKARVIERDGKVSLCVLDERWPFTYLQVYADATLEGDRELAVDVMMAVAGGISGQPLGEDARPYISRCVSGNTESSFAAAPMGPSPPRRATCTATTRSKSSPTGSLAWSRGMADRA